MKTKSLAVALPCLLFLAAGLAHAAPDAAPVKPDATAPAVTDAAAPASMPTKIAEPPAPTNVPEAVATGKSAWSAFKDGKLREGIAGVLVLLIFAWRRFAAKFVIGKLSTYQVGLVTAVVGLVATIPEALAMEPFDWKVFVWSGLLTSAQAMLAWKLVGQKVLPKVFGAPAGPEAPEAPEAEAAPKEA